jgi:hypothetical protein
MADLDAFRADTYARLEVDAPESLRGLEVTDLTGVWGGRNASFGDATWHRDRWARLEGY